MEPEKVVYYVRALREGDYKAAEQLCRDLGFSDYELRSFNHCYNYEGDYIDFNGSHATTFFFPNEAEFDDDLTDITVTGSAMVDISEPVAEGIKYDRLSCYTVRNLEGKEVTHCNVVLRPEDDTTPDEICNTITSAARDRDIKASCKVNEDRAVISFNLPETDVDRASSLVTFVIDNAFADWPKTEEAIETEIEDEVKRFLPNDLKDVDVSASVATHSCEDDLEDAPYTRCDATVDIRISSDNPAKTLLTAYHLLH